MDNLRQDIRFALRTLAKSPGFTAVSVLTIALGIGGNTAIFSVVNAVVLRPLPYVEPERLVVLWETNPQIGLPLMYASPPNYADWREQNRVFEEVGAYSPRDMFMSLGTETIRVQGAQVTASVFALLRTDPLTGRFFSAEEDGPGGGNPIVLSHGMWQRNFGSDAAMLGRNIEVDERSYTVIGIMPPGLDFPPPVTLEGPIPSGPAELWIPFGQDMKSGSRGAHNLRVIARLRPGISLGQAEKEMEALARRLEQDFPDTNAGWNVTLVPLDVQVHGDVRTPLLILLAAVGFVLLIACVNVANLLLARALQRRKELALRAALGAGHGRLVRQLMTESLLLAAASGALGLLVARLGLALLLRAAPQNIPRLQEASIDLSVAGFTIGLSILTGILFGLAPAVQNFSTHLSRRLRDDGRASEPAAGGSRLRSILVMAEVALAMTLLIGAGLLTRSFLYLRGADKGFQPRNVSTMRLTLPRARYAAEEERVAAFRELERRIQALPAVEKAGFTYDVPLGSDRQGTRFSIEGDPPRKPEELPLTNFTFVTPGYFECVGIPILQGRGFGDGDRLESPRVIVINEFLARRFFPGEVPLGRRLYVGGPDTPWIIVGVAGNEKHASVYQEPFPHVYVSYYQAPQARSLSLVARSGPGHASTDSAARTEIRAFDPSIAIHDVKSLDQVVSESISRPRFESLALGLFSAAGLLLACVGIYGLISYSVSRTFREFGIRLALGARPGEIFRLAIRGGMVPAAIGVAVGLIAATAVSRSLAGLLFGVSATDAATFLAMSLLLTAVAFLACFVPGRRATRTDPMSALRCE